MRLHKAFSHDSDSFTRLIGSLLLIQIHYHGCFDVVGSKGCVKKQLYWVHWMIGLELRMFSFYIKILHGLTLSNATTNLRCMVSKMYSHNIRCSRRFAGRHVAYLETSGLKD